MPAASLDGAGGGSDDHRMQIDTETSRVTEGSTEGASSAPLVATDRVPRRLHARAPAHQHGCTAGSHGRVEWPQTDLPR
eukprot:2538366-Prymnesium_polylepis.1